MADWAGGSADAPESGAADGSTDDADRLAAIVEAVRDVRREGWKATLVYAVVDAALALLAVNLALSVFAEDALPAVAVPSALLAPFLDGPVRVAISGSVLAGLAAAAAVFAGEIWLRTRRPLVERFERVNPEVEEALRTARDAAGDGADTRMARALYADVLDRLRRTSSLELLDLRRLAATVLLVVVLSFASVGSTVVALDVPVGAEPPPEAPGATPTPHVVPGGQGGSGPGYEGLRPPEDVLGEPEDVDPGSENLTAPIATGGGEGDREARNYDRSGLPTDPEVEAERAGFEAPPELADAELVREYNLRIREQEEREDER